MDLNEENQDVGMEQDQNKLSIGQPSPGSSPGYPLTDGGSNSEKVPVTKVTDDQGNGSDHFSNSDEDEETQNQRTQLLTYHDPAQVVGDSCQGVRTRCMLFHGESAMFSCFLSTTEPSTVEEALADSKWITAMQDKINEFTRNDICYLVDCLSIKMLLVPNGSLLKRWM